MALPLAVPDEPGTLAVRAARRLGFGLDGEPDGPLLIFGAHVAVGLGDSKGVVEQAL